MSNSESKWDVFQVSFILGFAVAIGLFQLPFTNNHKAQKALRECEVKLQRDQHCHITAEPDEPSISNSSN